MEKVVPNSKFVGPSTEIIQHSKIKGPIGGSLLKLISIYYRLASECSERLTILLPLC